MIVATAPFSAGPWRAIFVLWAVVLALLIALVIVRGFRDRRSKRDAVDEERIRELLLGYAAGTVGRDELRPYVGRRSGTKRRRRKRSHQVAAVYAKVGGEPGARIGDLLESLGVDDEMPSLLRSRSAHTRKAAAEYLARANPPGVTSELVAALRDRNRVVRVSAAYGLIDLATPDTARALLAATEGSRGIPRVFASDVGVRMGPVVADVMTDALIHPSPVVRMVAADVTGQLGVMQAAPRLESLVRDRRLYGDVAIRAAFALGELAMARSVPVLAECISPESTPQIRYAAGLALGGIDEAAARGVLSAHLDGEPDLARTAAEALGRSAPGRELLLRQAALGLGEGQRARAAAWGLWASEQPTAPLADLPLSDAAYAHMVRSGPQERPAGGPE